MEKEKEGEKTKITVRLSQMDVSELKKKATKMGTTYQSIIQSLIHKFLQRPDATA
jgi:predicted DNA binding CopG/RHH family protein